MPDMQEENNEETEEKESKGSMGPSTHPALEGEVKSSGWEVKLVSQDEAHVTFRVSCMDEDRDWFKLVVRAPKNKFKKI